MHTTAYYGVPLSLQPERHKFPLRPRKLFTGNYQPGRDSRPAFVERQQPAKHFRWHNFIHGPNPRDVGGVAFTHTLKVVKFSHLSEKLSTFDTLSKKYLCRVLPPRFGKGWKRH